MDFLFLASNYYYAKPSNKVIEALSEDLVLKGVDLKHLAEISYGSENSASKNQLINDFFRDNNFSFPSHFDAGMYLVSYYFEMILRKDLSAYEGAKKNLVKCLL